MPDTPRALSATFCFVDLCGFTALTEAHGDAGAADLVERFLGIVRSALGGDGRLEKIMGDAVFVTAPEPAIALRFAQRLFAAASREADFPMLRAGLHHGDAVERDGEIFGAAVNLAARVAALARGDQVLGTEPIADAAIASAMPVKPLGPRKLRNVLTPVPLFDIDVGAGDGFFVDPVCRMKVATVESAATLLFEGRTLSFCSRKCLSEFTASPDAYLDQIDRADEARDRGIR